MNEQRIILSDDLLPTQRIGGREHGAFYGMAHPLTDGSGPDGQAFHDQDFHGHVAILTVRDGVARSIEYVHSLTVTCNQCGREYDTEDEDVELGGPCPDGLRGEVDGCPGNGVLTGPFPPAPTTIAPEPAYDFSLNDQGTIFVLTALSDRARAWVEENVSTEGYNPDLPNRVYVEHRFVDAILEGITVAGLTVDAVERALAGRA